MSTDRWSLHVAAMGLHCPRCSAEPGEKCVTSSGNQSRVDHVARTSPLTTAYVSGYNDGCRDGMLRATTRGGSE